MTSSNQFGEKKRERKTKDCMCILGLWVKRVEQADDYMRYELETSE